MSRYMCRKCGCEGNILIFDVKDTANDFTIKNGCEGFDIIYTLKRFKCGSCGYEWLDHWEYVTDAWSKK